MIISSTSLEKVHAAVMQVGITRVLDLQRERRRYVGSTQLGAHACLSRLQLAMHGTAARENGEIRQQHCGCCKCRDGGKDDGKHCEAFFFFFKGWDEKEERVRMEGVLRDLL